MTILRCIRESIRSIYVAMRALPYLFAQQRGRFHIFRNAPDWLIAEMMKLDDASHPDVLGMRDAAKCEYVMRLRRSKK